jgi:hypothetical protein
VLLLRVPWGPARRSQRVNVRLLRLGLLRRFKRHFLRIRVRVVSARRIAKVSCEPSRTLEFLHAVLHREARRVRLRHGVWRSRCLDLARTLIGKPAVGTAVMHRTPVEISRGVQARIRPVSRRLPSANKVRVHFPRLSRAAGTLPAWI